MSCASCGYGKRNGDVGCYMSEVMKVFVLPPRPLVKTQNVMRTLGKCGAGMKRAVRHAVKRRRLLASIILPSMLLYRNLATPKAIRERGECSGTVWLAQGRSTE